MKAAETLMFFTVLFRFEAFLDVVRVAVVRSTTMAVTMLMEGGPHDNVDEDAQAGCDQHCLGLDHELLVDHPEYGHVDNNPGDKPDHEDGDRGYTQGDQPGVHDRAQGNV